MGCLFFSVSPEVSHSVNQHPTNIFPEVNRIEFSLKLIEGDSKISDNDRSYIIPLIRIGRLLIMEATVDGESGNLIFDTGATGLVLNRSYFRDHVISGEQSSSGITGNVLSVDRITADKLKVAELTLTKLSASLADLGHIENRRGIKVLGLFGFELIKSFEIILDNFNNQLILRPIDRKGNPVEPMKNFTADYVQKVEMKENIVFMKAEIGGKVLRFCFDTGAETNALNSRLGGNVLGTVSVTRTVKLQGAGTVSREVVYGLMNELTMGDTIITGMQTIVTYMDHLNDAYGIQIDGVLGFDFISRGNFCINFVKNEVRIAYIKQGGA